MLKKSLWIGAITVIVTVISACCPEIAEDYFQINRLEITAMTLKPHGSAFMVNDQDVDTLKDETLAFKLVAFLDLVASRRYDFSLINNAYALQCMDKVISAKDSIVSLKVVTLSDFNDVYPAGSNITALFKKLQYGSNPAVLEGRGLEEAVADLNSSLFFHGNPTGNNSTNLFLEAYPAHEGTMQFEFVLTTRIGFVFKVLSSEIYFKP